MFNHVVEHFLVWGVILSHVSMCSLARVWLLVLLCVEDRDPFCAPLGREIGCIGYPIGMHTFLGFDSSEIKYIIVYG